MSHEIDRTQLVLCLSHDSLLALNVESSSVEGVVGHDTAS